MIENITNQELSEPIRPKGLITNGSFIESTTMCYALGDLDYYLLKNHTKTIWTSLETFKGAFFGFLILIIGKVLAKGLGFSSEVENWEYFVLVLSAFVYIGCWIYSDRYHDSDRKKVIKKIDKFFDNFNNIQE